jgi:hypothetical protein
VRETDHEREWRGHVLSEIKELRGEITKVREDQVKILTQLSSLRHHVAGIASLVGAVVSGAIAFAKDKLLG